MKITKDIWILLTEYDELSQIEIIFYKNNTNLVKPYLYYTNKNDASLLKMDENSYVYFAKISIEKNSEFKFAIIGEQEVIKYEIYLGNSAEECYLVREEKCESSISSNNFEYNSTKNSASYVIANQDAVCETNTEEINVEKSSSKANQDINNVLEYLIKDFTMPIDLRNTDNSTDNIVDNTNKTEDIIINDIVDNVIDNIIDKIEDDTADNKVDNIVNDNVDVIDNTDANVTANDTPDNVEETEIDTFVADEETDVHNVSDTDVDNTENDTVDVIYNNDDNIIPNDTIDNVKDTEIDTFVADEETDVHNVSDTDVDNIENDKIDVIYDTDDTDTKVLANDTADNVENNETDDTEDNDVGPENQSESSEIINIEDTNELNIDTIFNVDNNNSFYDTVYIEKGKNDLSSNMFEEISLENLIKTLNNEDSNEENNLDENIINNSNTENNIDDSINNDVVNNEENNESNIDNNVEENIENNLKNDDTNSFDNIIKKESEGKHCKKTTQNNNFSFQSIIDTIDNFDFSLNGIKETKKESSDDNIFENFITKSINKTYFKDEPVYSTNLEFEKILKNNTYDINNYEIKEDTNSIQKETQNNTTDNDNNEFVFEWSIPEESNINANTYSEDTTADTFSNLDEDESITKDSIFNECTLLNEEALFNTFETENEETIFEDNQLENNNTNENKSLIVSQDKSLQTHKRHGLRFSYKMNKKIKIALIKLYRTLPNFLKGDYRRRINL